MTIAAPDCESLRACLRCPGALDRDYRDALRKPTIVIVGSHEGSTRKSRSTCWNSKGLSAQNLADELPELTTAPIRSTASREGQSLSSSSCCCSSPEICLAHLTPELSRDAQRPSGVLHDSATSEGAKRSRLERIVRRMKWAVCTVACGPADCAEAKICHQAEA